MAYLGNNPTTQSFISGTDYFNGTGAQTAFTLTRTVASVNDIEAVVNNVVQQPNDAYTISGTTITFTSAPSAGTSNVYVRYLSTTTQAISPSQGTVNYNTLDSNMQSAISTGMKNRIINGAMVIDQRNAGASVTGNNNVFGVDRFRAANTQNSKLTMQQNAGSVTPPVGFTNYLGITSSSAYSVTSTDYFLVGQPIEGFNTADLGWGTANAKTVTLSFQVYSSLTGTFGGSINNSAYNRSYPFSYTISSANTWTTISVTIAGDTTGTWIGATNGVGMYVWFGLGVGSTGLGTANTWAGAAYYSPTGATSVVGTNGATLYITGVQLEVGASATGFEYRQYTTELNLCQRYYWKNGGANQYVRVGTGPANTTTAALITVFQQTAMRSQPTAVTQTGVFGVWAGATVFSVSAIAVDTTSTSPYSTCLSCTSSGLTVGTTYQLIGNNDGTAAIALSAEL